MNRYTILISCLSPVKERIWRNRGLPLPPLIRYKHITRYKEIATILFEEGLGSLLDQLGLQNYIPAGRKLMSKIRREPPLSLEERFRRSLERLGPTFVKIGQILSTRPDLVPPGFIKELEKLQDKVPPAPYDQIKEQLEQALGGTVEQIFAEFDPTPIAAASIGQVHSAVLNSGEDVVVKIQRPHIETRIETDLDILLTQAHFIEAHTSWGKNYNLTDNAEEFRRILRNELDYILEGTNADRFRAHFEGNDTVVFPRVFWDYTTNRVITLERLSGLKLNQTDEIEKAGFVRSEVAQAGVNIYLEQIFVHAFYQADPHPGNLLLLENGKIGFLDFGMVGLVSKYTKQLLGDLFLAIINRDEIEIVNVLLEVGITPVDIEERKLQAEVARLLNRYFDASLEQIRVNELIEEIMRLIFEYRLRVPSEFTLLLKTLGELEGVGLKLDPHFNLVESVKPFTRTILKERFSFESVSGDLLRTIRQTNNLLFKLPQSVNRLIDKTLRGKLRMEFEPQGYEHLMNQLREIVDRISFTILIASFVVGFSLILGRATLPGWILTVSEIVLGLAAVVGLWLFISIFISFFHSR
jgi:ubiquinone biosynthesis protein